MKRPVAPTFLVVDKPAGITSHDVVAAVRALIGAKRVGHTGTLDPFATGVLPLALGPATRLISFLDESHKVYDAVLELGRATETGDPEGEVTQTGPVPELDSARVEAVLATFEGPRMQTPPPYSAVKVNGRPLYAYARAGETVEVPARPIQIHQMTLLGLEPGRVRFRVACGRGTYVRVLGEELAAALGTVGHLVALRRLKSGPFELEDAVTVDELAAIAMGGPVPAWRPVLRPRRDEPRSVWRDRMECRADVLARGLPATVGFSSLPVLSPDAAVVDRLLRSGTAPAPPEGTGPGDRFIVVDAEGLVALCENRDGKGKAVRVLARPPAPSPASPATGA